MDNIIFWGSEVKENFRDCIACCMFGFNIMKKCYFFLAVMINENLFSFAIIGYGDNETGRPIPFLTSYP